MAKAKAQNAEEGALLSTPIGAPVYSPPSWYWLVGNKPGVVFSAPAAAYVALTDAGYQAFQSAGGVATAIENDGELAWVLWKQGLTALAAVAGTTSLGAEGGMHPTDAIGLLSAIGIALTSTGTPALNGTFSLSAVPPAPGVLSLQAQITTEAVYIQATGGPGAGKFTNGQTTKAWPDITGAPHTFDTTQFINFAEAAGQFIDAVIDWGPAWGADSSTPPPSNAKTIA